MKKGIFFILIIVLATSAFAQDIKADTVIYSTVTIEKDKRIDILGEKMNAYNTALANNIRSGKGYRLMLLSTNDRNLAMQLRATLLQQFPEHKVYMIYQSPFIKLKMGNFVEKADAEKLKNQLLVQRIVTGNIYILPENVEITPESLAGK